MELRISSPNTDLTPAVRQYVESKLSKVNRHLPGISEAKVEITEEKTKSARYRFVAKVTISSQGKLLYGEERGEDILTVIDRVTEVMNRQIEHHKGKLYDLSLIHI